MLLDNWLRISSILSNRIKKNRIEDILQITQFKKTSKIHLFQQLTLAFLQNILQVEFLQ